MRLTTVLTARFKTTSDYSYKNSVIIGCSTTECISESITNQLINSLTYFLTYLLTYLLTNYMQHIFFENLTVALNIKVHCCVQDFSFDQCGPNPHLLPHLHKTPFFSVILPSTLQASKLILSIRNCDENCRLICLHSHSCYVPHHYPRLSLQKNI